MRKILRDLSGSGQITKTQNEMNVIKTDIGGVVIIEPKVFGDHRGYFFESFSERDFNVGMESVILNEAAISDSLQMTHPLDVSGFKSIDKSDLSVMKYYNK